MNIPLALMDAIRRVAARRESPRLVENRTYVFILVPFDFRKNGNARKAHIASDLIGNGSHVDDTRADALFSTIAALDRASSRITSETDLSDDRELNYDLMWTWFLPNPLSPPNKSNCDPASLFPFGLNGFNTNKTRRDS
jgi:hypothetical protein